ncbi:expressed unknown protein [Seminavis robusta]|uniref:Uncharacterized protein n=1 Tax=Seminavis robusta TaxID=568900 RepID=A0A9N8EHE1_9STRA|nr:expressed unknown protein [Seminavis robusta]|eukprot:Sro998_g229470.1 n/a (607) ;mRNA; f:1275-3095
MSASVDRYYHPEKPLQHQANFGMMEKQDDEQSLSESHLSEDGDVDIRRKEGQQQQEDDLVSKSSMSSMSVFMNSLVGVHQSEDWSFCLQVDNAKPRDLPSPSATAPAVDSGASAVSITRKNNGLSRWESTPSKNTPVAPSTRVRAMRPWRPPPTMSSASSSLNSNNSSFVIINNNNNNNSTLNNNSTHNNNNSSNINGSTRKLDAPMPRPQRYDSNRSLNTNAKRPQRYDSNRSLNQRFDSNRSLGQRFDSNRSLGQRFDSNRSLGQRYDSNRSLGQRYDSNRSLNREFSISDLSKQPSVRSLSSPNQPSHVPFHHDKSMDLRVLLEYEEDNFDDSVIIEGNEGQGVYLKIPTMQSSLWSSASTMTASFRTMASNRSLLSHYSISSVANHSHNNNNSVMHNYSTSSSWNSSHRSLFCKSQEELPMRPPSRTKSREQHFQSNACERAVRRPVRIPSDRSMLSTSVHQSPPPDTTTATPPPAAAAAAVVLANTTSACDSLLPALNYNQEGEDSTSHLEFRLIRSLSEQTLETAVLWQQQQLQQPQTLDAADNAVGYRYLKRTLSDSLLFSSQDFNSSSMLSESINSSSAHLSSFVLQQQQQLPSPKND